MNDTLWVTIPTKNRRQYIPSIIEQSGVPKNQIVIVHTDKDNEFFDDVHNIRDLDEVNIQRWWNKGINYAQERGARYVAVLNDDVELSDNPLQKIVEGMKRENTALGYPFPYQGWVCGYCFIIDLSTDVRPDEAYRWWYGDRDLDLQAIALDTRTSAAGVSKVFAKVKHLHGNELTRASNELMELTKNDEELFFTKWNIKKQS